MRNALVQGLRSLAFAFWSMRRRGGHIVPVTVAFLLLLTALQALGALHNVSSQLVQTQIARSWRGSYDLLLRPPTAVSQPERDSGWIDPQSLLETYGGITPAQAASVAALPHIAAVTPLATIGWQPITIQVHLQLPAQTGIYRISLSLDQLQYHSAVETDYVEVTDLAHLTSEPPLPGVLLHYVVLGAHPLYTITVQALQSLIGVSSSAEPTLAAQLQTDLNPLPPAHLTLKSEQLQASRAYLPLCLTVLTCWRSIQPPATGPLSSQAGGEQLWRFSRTTYRASSGQLAGSTISLLAPGADVQGALYRLPQPEDVALPAALANSLNAPVSAVLPFALAQHLPLLPAALRFIPLAQACGLNGSACYSGLYVRLNGAECYSQQSLALLQASAATIMARTGLHVDILDGSSLRQVSLQLPSPAQPLRSTWRATGVAVQIVSHEDTLQNLLLTLATLVCLFALCSAGILVGVGRRKDALLLSHLGWRHVLLRLIFTLDALLLACPALTLICGWLLFLTQANQSTLSPFLTWILLAVGLVVYSAALAVTACRPLREKKRGRAKDMGQAKGMAEVWGMAEASSATTRKGPARQARWRQPRGLTLGGLRRPNPPQCENRACLCFPVRVVAELASAMHHGAMLVTLIAYLALTAAVFLLVLTVLLLENLQQALAVTVLGGQVSTALALPHLVLFVVILGAAVLTLVLSTSLRFTARRAEFALLANLGWERRHVFWRLMREAGLPGLICGLLGACLALVLLLPGAQFSWWLALGALCLFGPLCGLIMAGTVTGVLAWLMERRLSQWR